MDCNDLNSEEQREYDLWRLTTSKDSYNRHTLEMKKMFSSSLEDMLFWLAVRNDRAMKLTPSDYFLEEDGYNDPPF